MPQQLRQGAETLASRSSGQPGSHAAALYTHRARVEYDLVSMSIGIWATRRSHKKLFILNDRKAFVLLAGFTEHDARRRGNSRLGRALQVAQQKLVDKRNPFALPPDLAATTAVIALEVQWADIQGMDYMCPLHHDGRLVLEARSITKRVFHSMAEARQFYCLPPHPQAPSPTPFPAAHAYYTNLASTGGAAGTPDAVSPHAAQFRSAPGTPRHLQQQQQSVQQAGGSPKRTHRRVDGLVRVGLRGGPSHPQQVDPQVWPAGAGSSGGEGWQKGAHTTNAAAHATMGADAPSRTIPLVPLPALATKLTDSEHMLPSRLNGSCSEPQPGEPAVHGSSKARSSGRPGSARRGSTGAVQGWHAWATSWVPGLRGSSHAAAHSSSMHGRQHASCLGRDDSFQAHSLPGTLLASVSSGAGTPNGFGSSQPTFSCCSPSGHTSDFCSDTCISPGSMYATPKGPAPAHASTSCGASPRHGAMAAATGAGAALRSGETGLPERPLHVRCRSSSSHALLNLATEGRAQGASSGCSPRLPLCASAPLQPASGVKHMAAGDVAATSQVPHASPSNTPRASHMSNSSALPGAPAGSPHRLATKGPFAAASITPPDTPHGVSLSTTPASSWRALGSSSTTMGVAAAGAAGPASPWSPFMPCQDAAPGGSGLSQPTLHLGSVNGSIAAWDIGSPLMLTPRATPCSTPPPEPAEPVPQMGLGTRISLLSLALRPLAAARNARTAQQEEQQQQQQPGHCTEAGQQPASGDAFGGAQQLQHRQELPAAAVVGEFKGHTVVMTFKDPLLPPMLSRVVKGDMRILKLYESGLPAWAIFLPSYGLWYRPWMRRAYFLLVTAVSIISMAMGFYDLYKNVPIVRQAMAALSRRLVFFDAQQLFEWLEKHAQIRLSILLTYIFSKSPLFVTLMRFLRTCMTSTSHLAAPLLSALRNAAAPLGQLVTSCLQPAAAGLAYLLQPLVALCSTLRALFSMLGAQLGLLGSSLAALGALLLGPPLQALWALLLVLGRAGLSLLQLGSTVLYAPLYLGSQACAVVTTLLSQAAAQLSWVGLLARSTWSALAAAGQAAKGVLPAARATGSLVSAAARSSRPVAAAAASSGGAGWWLFARAGHDAVAVLDFLRTSVYRCVKALQAVLNGLLALALTAIKHRVSLFMQLQRYLWPRKRYLPPAVHRLIEPQPSLAFTGAFSPEVSMSLKLQDYDAGPLADTAVSTALSPPSISSAGLRHRAAAAAAPPDAQLGASHAPGVGRHWVGDPGMSGWVQPGLEIAPEDEFGGSEGGHALPFGQDAHREQLPGGPWRMAGSGGLLVDGRCRAHAARGQVAGGGRASLDHDAWLAGTGAGLRHSCSSPGLLLHAQPAGAAEPAGGASAGVSPASQCAAHGGGLPDDVQH